MQPLQGQLLVASPTLVDSPFSQTVILILQHTDEQVWGVVLNRVTDALLSDSVGTQHLHLGGPITSPVLALHGCRSLAEAALPSGIFVAVDTDRIAQLVMQDEHPVRIIFGLSGWTANQLEEEFADGIWLTLPATAEHVFGEADELWPLAMQEASRSFIRSLGIKHIPADPSVN